jgi:hypothetical protein
MFNDESAVLFRFADCSRWGADVVFIFN